MSFISELMRRNVIRVGIAYIVVGWILAQVAEFAFENFGAPEWVLKSFVVVLLLGLPIAVMFAWAFELTPQGVKRERDVDRSRTITSKTGRRLDFLIIGALAVGQLRNRPALAAGAASFAAALATVRLDAGIALALTAAAGTSAALVAHRRTR